jgi:hypothetical protein
MPFGQYLPEFATEAPTFPVTPEARITPFGPVFEQPIIPEPPPVTPEMEVIPTPAPRRRRSYSVPEREPERIYEPIEPPKKGPPWLLIGGLVLGYYWLKKRRKKRR